MEGMTHSENTRTLAACVGGITLAWYAMPDAVRSRGVRALLKTGLLAAAVPATIALAPKGDASAPDLPWPPPPKLVVAGSALLIAGTAATIWGEKAVFALGERRRARGVRFAHTLPALGLAALAALTVRLGEGDASPSR